MKLFKLLPILFLISITFGGCASLRLQKEAATVPDGHLRVSIINDTDVLMYHHTSWVNHNVPDIKGPAPMCGGEIRPGKDHTFDQRISSWSFKGDRIFRTKWSLLRYRGPDKAKKYEKYKNELTYRIPVGTAIIKVYHKHYKAIPR